MQVATKGGTMIKQTEFILHLWLLHIYDSSLKQDSYCNYLAINYYVYSNKASRVVPKFVNQ